MSGYRLKRTPKRVVRERREIDFAEYRRKSAEDTDFAELVDEPVSLYEPGAERPSVIYLELDGDFSDLVGALQRINYLNSARTDGMQSHSKIFGNQPRVGFRRPWCTKAAMAKEHGQEHDTFLRYMAVASGFYEQFHPELYHEHAGIVQEKIIEDWRIEESVFTSGIANKNNPLPYHFDTGNFKGVWSNMFCFKSGVTGGHLSVPEFDLGFKLRNNSLLMFDGQSLLHGVTPIGKLHDEAYRFTVVFYALQQMWKCLPPKEELRQARAERTKREQARYERIKAGTEKEHRRKMVDK